LTADNKADPEEIELSGMKDTCQPVRIDDKNYSGKIFQRSRKFQQKH
jgi:hypothetical protein